MLGVAAGDTAGGAWELGYSALTEQVVVITYELIEHRELEPNRLVRSLRELDGSEDGASVYRSETPHFRAWLDRAAAGPATPGMDPALDGAVRAAPVGVAFRRDAGAVTRIALELSRLFHDDAASIAAGLVAASAVAASCFAQSGRDLVAGVREAVIGARQTIQSNSVEAERLDGLETEFERLLGSVGVREGGEALEIAGGDRDDPLTLMLAGLLLAAPITDRHHGPIEQAARIGGSVLGAAVGGIMGARVGIRAWPWAFANDTWFAEIGRRLVRGPDEVRDLPIPYAVEQHLMSGSHPGFH